MFKSLNILALVVYFGPLIAAVLLMYLYFWAEKTILRKFIERISSDQTIIPKL